MGILSARIPCFPTRHAMRSLWWDVSFHAVLHQKHFYIFLQKRFTKQLFYANMYRYMSPASFVELGCV